MRRMVIGYRRVSTSEQAGSGLGLEGQQAAIMAAAGRLGQSVRETFTDAGLSGGLPLEQRPALIAALEALRRGDVLLVAKRDRIGRDLLNVALITRLVERKGARIVSAAGEGTDDDGPAGVLMRQIIDAFAEYERGIIRARTRVALKARKARGLRAGEVPYGFVADATGRLTPNAHEQQIIATVAALSAAGCSTRAIAERLNRDGLTTRRGSSWRFQYINRILRTQPATEAGHRAAA